MRWARFANPRPSAKPRVKKWVKDLLASYGPALTSALAVPLQRSTYMMSGPIGGALGETLLMLLSNEVVLRDVHLFNIGWRIHGEIEGFGYAHEGIVIFDPGHTPTGRNIAIPTARLENPLGGGDWEWYFEGRG